MAGRFPLFTDENIGGPLVVALRQRGWNVVRAVDVFGERTDDEALLQHSVEGALALVSTDADLLVIAKRWLDQARSFRLVWWEQAPHQKMRPAAFVAAFEELADRDEPFSYPIVYLKPRG